jgi:two-component system osmolarity sensor histidine kinase EnvZ
VASGSSLRGDAAQGDGGADLAQLYPVRRRRRLGFGRWIKRFLPRTLFARSFLIITVPVVLAQAIATFVFYDRHWDAMTNRLAYAVAGEIAFLLDELAVTASPEEQEAVLKRAAAMELYVTALPGERLPAEPQALHGILEKVLAKALAEKVQRPFRINTHIARERYEIRVQLPDGVLSVVSPERRLYSFTSYLFIAWMLGSSVVLFAIAILFMRNQIRPIRRLALAADAFGKGRDVPNFKPEGAAEVRQAASAFMTMRERIQRQISQRTQMLAGVSHDLRTPLTRMRLQLAMLPPGPDIDDLQADVADMETMIEGYLAFARGEGAEPTQPIALAPLLSEVAANARREGAEVMLELDGTSLVLPLRPNALKRCIANLVGNARRYGGGRVWLSLRRTGEWVEILVDDDGPGIPADMRADVFRPFARLDPARNSETGGAGLGLTIARDVARRHGGDVLLDDSPRGGLRAVIRLPL